MWKSLIIENAILILGITIILCLINVVVLIKKNRLSLKEIKLRDYIDILWKSMLPAYLFAVVNITFIDKYQGGMISSTINLLPFKSLETMLFNSVYSIGYGIELDFIIGNILLFLPFGFLVPAVFSKVDKYYKIFAISLGSVLFVEIMQVVLAVGCCDADDIIYNVSGSIFGYGIYLIYSGVFINKNKKMKKIIVGLMPYIIVGVLFVVGKIIYTCSPYGITPGMHIYDAKEQKGDVKVDFDADDDVLADYVCIDRVDGIEYDENKSVYYVKNYFNYLNVEYYKENISDDDNFEKYISKDGNYSVRVYKNSGGLCFYNEVKMNAFEEEKKIDDDEKVNKVFDNKNLDKIFVDNTTDTVFNLLKRIGINMTDKSYCEISGIDNRIRYTFSGYIEDNKKIVKIVDVNITHSGEIASISVGFDKYSLTKDKIKIISTKEALKRLKDGKSGDHIKKNDEILSVSMSWWEPSTKGYYLPLYNFFILSRKDGIDYIWIALIPAWEVE